MKQVLFRWATGDGDSAVYCTNIAVASLQRFCPESSFCVSYNGKDFPKFCKELQAYDNIIDFDNLILRKQTDADWAFGFGVIGGAWWKWAPFNLHIKPIEIFLDTDVLFIRKPTSIINWVKTSSNMLAGRDVIGNLLTQNVGDFKGRLRGYKDIINVGIVGLKDDIWRNLFKKYADNIPMSSPRSYHINEQGAANMALHDLDRIGGFHITRIPVTKFTWWQPFTYEISETLHFIALQKIALEECYSFFREVCICDDISVYQQGFEYLQEVGFHHNFMNKEAYYKHCCKMDRPINAPEKDWRRSFETS